MTPSIDFMTLLTGQSKDYVRAMVTGAYTCPTDTARCHIKKFIAYISYFYFTLIDYHRQGTLYTEEYICAYDSKAVVFNLPNAQQFNCGDHQQ